MGNVVKKVGSAIKSAAKWVWNGAKRVGRAVWRGVRNVGNGIKSAGKWVWKGVKKMGTAIRITASSVWTVVKQPFYVMGRAAMWVWNKAKKIKIIRYLFDHPWKALGWGLFIVAFPKVALGVFVVGKVATKTAYHLTDKRTGNKVVVGNSNEQIHFYARHVCRLVSEDWNWLPTGLAQFLTFGRSPPVEHHWAVIGTDKAWYNIQLFFNGDQVMTRCGSKEACNREGLDCIRKGCSRSVWVEGCVTPTSHPELVTLDMAKSFIQSEQFALGYNIVDHNCQHFAAALLSEVDLHYIKKGQKELGCN